MWLRSWSPSSRHTADKARHPTAAATRGISLQQQLHRFGFLGHDGMVQRHVAKPAGPPAAAAGQQRCSACGAAWRSPPGVALADGKGARPRASWATVGPRRPAPPHRVRWLGLAPNSSKILASSRRGWCPVASARAVYPAGQAWGGDHGRGKCSSLAFFPGGARPARNQPRTAARAVTPPYPQCHAHPLARPPRTPGAGWRHGRCHRCPSRCAARLRQVGREETRLGGKPNCVLCPPGAGVTCSVPNCQLRPPCRQTTPQKGTAGPGADQTQ